ncbi:neuroblastoma-amplified sequence-like [Sinocyclocheilus anshuiensis]|uniref:neuroblastoma-amplified sequence-like n=1 Tax=Sinocyclocheilus anshuiensis TaxID=1608454 RepID=UPI0007BAB84C|nr:PREDICTED: neuroblastoma-amplified sequence-like [Sinocyclocheilus anshuiensis]
MFIWQTCARNRYAATYSSSSSSRIYLLLRGLKEHNSSLVAKAVTGPFRFILHYLWYSPSSSTLPPGLVRLATKQLNWQLVLASNGKLLAVVQDQCVEMRSARDDFGSIIFPMLSTQGSKPSLAQGSVES